MSQNELSLPYVASSWVFGYNKTGNSFPHVNKIPSMPSFALLWEFFSLYRSLSQEASPSKFSCPTTHRSPNLRAIRAAAGAEVVHTVPHISISTTLARQFTYPLLKCTSHVSTAWENGTIQSQSVLHYLVSRKNDLPLPLRTSGRKQSSLRSAGQT